MNTLTVVVGFTSDWETHLKKVELAKSGIKAIGHHVHESHEFEDIRTIKSTINSIINKVRFEDGGSSVIFTNSEMVIVWISNAVHLSKVSKAALAETLGMTPINEEQVNVYLFEEKNKKIVPIQFGTYGYEITYMNEALNDLFAATIEIHDHLQIEE